MLDLPTEFIEKYQQLLGEEEAQKLVASLQTESKKAYRINSLKFKQKTPKSTDQPVPDIPHAYYGEVSSQDPEWVSGSVYSQDPAAMFPAYIAKVEPGENVLDLCAAPGGKTTALGEALKNKGLLVANEISATRVKALRENLERFGISNALITNNDSEALAKKFPNFFDTILVDAPCSGEGMFRKNPDAITYWSQDYVLTCAERQKDILTEAVKMLKPNGKLIYSTCTFSPEEDEAIVLWLVEKYGMTIEKANHVVSEKVSYGNPSFINSDLEDLKKTLRFWPQDNLGEGQFAAILRMPDEEVEVKSKKKKKQKNRKGLTNEEKGFVKKVLDHFNLPESLQNWEENACVRQDHVFIPAINHSELKGLKIVNNGVELGLLKKNRFEPGHQLAEVLGQVDQENVVELDSSEDYKKYLHGETLRVKTELRGFILVAREGFIFSFGKVTGNGVLKNFYPKGLRILKDE